MGVSRGHTLGDRRQSLVNARRREAVHRAVSQSHASPDKSKGCLVCLRTEAVPRRGANAIQPCRGAHCGDSALQRSALFRPSSPIPHFRRVRRFQCLPPRRAPRGRASRHCVSCLSCAHSPGPLGYHTPRTKAHRSCPGRGRHSDLFAAWILNQTTSFDFLLSSGCMLWPFVCPVTFNRQTCQWRAPQEILSEEAPNSCLVFTNASELHLRRPVLRNPVVLASPIHGPLSTGSSSVHNGRLMDNAASSRGRLPANSIDENCWVTAPALGISCFRPFFTR